MCVCWLLVVLIMMMLLSSIHFSHSLVCDLIEMRQELNQPKSKTHFHSKSKSGGNEPEIRPNPFSHDWRPNIKLHLIRCTYSMPQQEIASAIQGKIRSDVKVIQNCTLFMYSLHTYIHTNIKFANHFK